MNSFDGRERPQPRTGVLAIDPYRPGKSGSTSASRIYKLSSNETPLGPSPHAKAALQKVAERLALYPDGSAAALREAIGARYGLDPARIVCGAGSDELISFLAHAFVGPGDEGISTRHGFSIYRIVILAAGGTPIIADETNLTSDVDAILAKVTEQDEDHLSRQSQQSDRDLSALRRDQAIGRGLAAPYRSRARCRLCRICDAQ